MKKIYTILSAVLITASVFAQAPEKMSYQALIRDAANSLVTSTTVGMQISILQGTATGTSVFVETQTPTSNINGLVSLEIGTGTIISGSFNTIDWSNGPYFIKTETDPTGGATYTITGTSQLLSVPYALYAKTSGSSTPGPQGPAGAIGPQGPIGLTGAAGTNGIDGVDGAVGATGPQGPIGLTGTAGADGIDGVDGAVGTTGPQGPIGLTGPAGIDGVDGAVGATGPQGPIGLTGAAGTNGIDGIDGAVGATGPQGSIGLTGAAGSNGIDGVDGAVGATGPQGPIGLTGAAGTNGIDGVDGAVGVTGPQGPIGLIGTAGSDGIDGVDGAVGATGPQGPIGLTGANGATGSANINGTTNYVVKFTGATTGGNSQIFDNGTNVGIGTTTPLDKLHVEAGSVITNGEGQGVIVDANGLNRVGLMKYGGLEGMLIGGSTSAIPLRLGRWTGGTIKAPTTVDVDMVISQTGNVGVGTTTPSAKLDVVGTVQIVDGTEGAGKVLTSDASGNASWVDNVDPVEAWQTPTLINGWVNYGGGFTNVGYYKDRDRVYLTGMIKSGAGPGNNIFILPAGYRPIARKLFDAISSGTQGRVDVDAAGNVIFMQGSNSWVSLDEISFRIN